ncbi:MAG: transglycosylase SLT domain-containing protein [Gemmatimonadetes bacterium]|nr:transglycosylase SLT domain-containing protein [Gemmatimonadota bacterium]
MRRSLAVLVLGGSLAGGPLAPSLPPARSRALETCPVVRAPASADTLLIAGRYWHALQVVPPPPPSRPLAAGDALLHAVIAEGLGRTARVDELVRRAQGGDSLPELLALAARADERAGRWALVEAKYRRLAQLPSAPPAMRAAATVRLAMALQQLGRLDSAIAAWRQAAQALPEIADWLALARAEIQRDTAVAFASLSAARTPGAAQRADLLVARRRLTAGNLRGALDVYRRLGRTLEIARVEYALGQWRLARVRADSVLFADPTKPAALLAATFLTGRYDTLSLREYLAVSRAYRARDDLSSAERFARRAIARSDTSVGAWLELGRIESERGDLRAALTALDSAAVRPRGRRRTGSPPATLIAFARAQALQAAGRWDEAAPLVDTLVRAHPGDSSIARAVLFLADHDRARGEAAKELARYRVLRRRFPGTPAANVARFRLGLLAYTRGAVDTAATLVAAAFARDSTRQLGLAPRYWDARLRLELGDSAAAAALRRIAAEYPLGYYGVRARQLLGDTSSLLVDTALALPKPGSFPPARARERIRLLASLGFDAEARAEATGWVGDTSASVHVLVAAAGAAADAGLAREAIALGEAARARAGMVPGVARALFPISYRAIVEAEAVEQCIDPLLLAAIIRQESRFEPRARSRAGARGIGQVMPSTGRQLAARMRLGSWDPDLLYVPDFNLHLGSRYLNDRINGDSLPIWAVLASYNAGPDRVARWRRWAEFDDADLFAERVSIRETHDYVKTVYANYVWYRQAYRPAPAPAPAEGPAAPVP